MRWALASAVFRASSAALAFSFSDQHAVIAFYDVENQILARLFGGKIRRSDQALCAALVKQRLAGIEKPPLPVETRLKVVQRRWRVQTVQGKVGGGKLSLRQLGSKDVHGIISAREVLVKIDSRVPGGLHLLQARARCVCFIGGGLECRILLQRHSHGLLECDRAIRGAVLGAGSRQDEAG